jgi:hypothetical protein
MNPTKYMCEYVAAGKMSYKARTVHQRRKNHE